MIECAAIAQHGISGVIDIRSLDMGIHFCRYKGHIVLFGCQEDGNNGVERLWKATSFKLVLQFKAFMRYERHPKLQE